MQGMTGRVFQLQFGLVYFLYFPKCNTLFDYNIVNKTCLSWTDYSGPSRRSWQPMILKIFRVLLKIVDSGIGYPSDTALMAHVQITISKKN